MKTFKLNEIYKYHFFIILLLLLLISFLLNKNLKKTNKLSLLLLAIIVCIYKPLYIIPFAISYFVLYNCSKKKNIVEGFVNDNFYNKLKENTELNVDDFKYIDEEKNEHKEFIKYLDDSKNDIDELKSIRDKTYFYQAFFKIFFFDKKNENDRKIANNIIQEINNFNDFIEMIEIDDTDNIFNNTINKIYDDEEEKLHKKLGLYFYKNKDNNYLINNQIINLIKKMGLFNIYNDYYMSNNISNIIQYNDYEEILKQDRELLEKYKLVKKYIYELAILHYQTIIEDNNTEYFKNVDSKELDFNPYLLFKNQSSFQINKIKEIFTNLTEYYLVRIPKRIRKNNEVKIYNLIKEKYIGNDSNSDEDEKILNSDNSLNLYFKFDKDDPSIKNLNKIEDKLNIIYDNFYNNLEDSDNNINLFIPKFYDIENNKKIAINYLTLLYIYNDNSFNTFLKEKVNKIKKYYTSVKTNFQQKIELEKDVGIYSFISDFDLFIDNIFFYLQENIGNSNIQKQLPEDYHIEKVIIAPSEQEGTTELNLDKEQYIYQKELEKEFDTNLLSDIQEKNLETYYKLIEDDKKREGLKYLSELAKENNIKNKQEIISVDYIIDNFSNKIFDIIDDFMKVIKMETFNNISPSPSDSISHFEKYANIIKNIINILLKEDRSLYSGFILIVLALLIYFIDGSKGNSCNCNSNKGLLSIFKT